MKKRNCRRWAEVKISIRDKIHNKTITVYNQNIFKCSARNTLNIKWSKNILKMSLNLLFRKSIPTTNPPKNKSDNMQLILLEWYSLKIKIYCIWPEKDWKLQSRLIGCPIKVGMVKFITSIKSRKKKFTTILPILNTEKSMNSKKKKWPERI